MSFDGAPPSYSEVVGEPGAAVPSAPPIAIPPMAPVIEPAPIGFDAFNEPARTAKEREAAGATNPYPGPGFEPEDDIVETRAAVPRATLEQTGKREFVIRLTCPSCDCSKLIPHCNNLACCKPDVGCLRKLFYADKKKVEKLFSNYYWSKITDRHFRYFFRKPEVADEPTADFINKFLFAIFLLVTVVMFLVTPWVALVSAIIFPCDQNSAVRPLIGSFGAVVLVESFMRSCCYVLHKIDRPPRAIKELESPNPLIFVMFGLAIAIFVTCGMVTPCGNATMLVLPSNATCCDPILVSVGYGIPIAWVVFQLLVMLGTSLKFMFVF